MNHNFLKVIENDISITCVCVCVYVCVYVCVCVYIYIYTYLHIYTHTHAYTPFTHMTSALDSKSLKIPDLQVDESSISPSELLGNL